LSAVARRLAAILAADVVGYSRLMGVDEAGTLERLKALRRELVQPKIAERSGRIVKLMGDGLLAEFPSVVEAVQCAVELQQDITAREPDLADDRRIRLRIGINLGDVMVEGSDIYGDGVNIAARLEALAEPGGICISGGAFDAIDGKLDLAFEDGSEQQVKNIAKPVRVYRLRTQGAHESPSALAEQPLAVPDKPSVAVLPFTNMSGDPEQDYFSDGITEDIITELSRFGLLFVIARNSSFVFRGAAVDVSEVGRKLGVRYVVEGSVRRSGKRVRVTAQLIDAATGNHVWAERYDRDLEDIFAVQDEVVQAIVATLAQRVSAAEVVRTTRRPIADMAVYNLILRAHHHIGVWTEEDYRMAKALLEKAVEIDPNCAQAYGTLAWCGVFLTWFEGDAEAPLQAAIDAGKRALSLDPQIVEAHTGLGHVHLLAGEHEQALHLFENAVRLNPNNANGILHLGYCHVLMGNPETGLREIRQALRLNPYHPAWYQESLGECLYMIRDHAGAVEAFNRMSHQAPWTHGYLAACYAQLGRMDEAREAVQAFRDAAKEGYSAEDYIRMDLPMYGDPAIRDHWLEGYRKAGLEV
jgi:TolB-like protein/Flp pilus assembly protein TadD